MILQTYKNVEDYIVEILAGRPNLNALILRKILADEIGKKYTIQAIYKVLNKLQEGGIVVKSKKIYRLRIPWVIDLEHLTKQMRRNYLESPSINDIMPDIGKKETWRFTNLLRLNDFWSQILVTLINQSKDKILLGYNPHLWFHLVQAEQEEQYIKSIGLLGGKLYLIVGSRRCLDKWADKYLDKKVVEVSFAESYFEERKSNYINVIDDYVLTIKIDPKTSRNIDQIYEETQSTKDINISKILKIFDSNTKGSIILEKHPEKANKIRQKFSNFFGVLL